MRRILLFMLLLCTSVLANAAQNELKIGITGATRYNDNIGNVSSGKKTDSFSFDIGPTVRFDSSAATYELGVNYSPQFSTFVNDGRDDELKHNLGIRGEFRPNERWTLGLRNRFELESDADRDTNEGSQVDFDGGGDKQTLRNSVSGNLRYGLTPRTSFSSNIGYTLVEREDKSLTDSTQISGRVQANYVVGARDTIGIGGSARQQSLTGEPISGIEDSSTDFFGFFLSWDHRFSPLMGVSATGGPTWVTTNLENDGESAKTVLDYFASAQVFTEFDKGSAAISYQRSSSDFSRSSTAFLIDIVTITADWAASRKLTLAASAGWNERNSVRSFTGTGFTLDDRVTQWRAAGTISYRLSRELLGSFTVDFLRQSSSTESASDRVRATLRFNYNARAFRF